MKRLTFLTHFILCLAFSAAFFFAWQRGVPQTVWANDVAGWFGATIAALTVSAAAWLGWQAWKADSAPRYKFHTPTTPWTADASYGHLVALLCPSVGMLGTVVGLSLSLAKVGDPAQMIASAHTAFYSTGVGIVGMIAVMLMTHFLEARMRRVQ